MPRNFPIGELTLEMRRSADDQYYVFGVTVDDVFIGLAQRKTGGIDDDFARADEAAAAAEADKASAKSGKSTTTG